MAKRRAGTDHEAMLIQSARQALAIARGTLNAANITERDVIVASPVAFGSRRVRRTRAKLGFSQTVFARALNVSAATVRAWEQGGREPDGAAVRLLEISAEHPELLLSKVRRVSEAQSRYNTAKTHRKPGRRRK